MKTSLPPLLALIITACAVATDLAPIHQLSAQVQIAQTAGLITPNQWTVRGDSHRWALEPLRRFAESRGYVVIFTPEITRRHLLGYVSYHIKFILINDDQSINTQVSTLAHEIGHTYQPDLLPLSAHELFAESVAYLTSRQLGLDTTRESFSYLSRFEDMDRARTFATYGDQIQAAANEIAAYVLKRR